MNPYLKNLEKLEFAVTDSCTGKCKHCSQGEHKCGAEIDPLIASAAVKRVAAEYKIKTVMTFGGEPLLHPSAVYEIISAAKDVGVPKRQLITNGYFSKSEAAVRDVAKALAECGVNDLLLSVDAFHQETIPLSAVMHFAKCAKEYKIPIRLQPAWLVSSEDKNPYNLKTREILNAFSDMSLPEGSGNTVFPEGNALKYLGEYFCQDKTKDRSSALSPGTWQALPKNPYIEDPKDIHTLSFSADGAVLSGNIYKTDIMEIIKIYNPD